MRLRARPGLARFRRDGVNLHMRQSRVPEAERLGGGSRNIDDASTDERPPIHNPEDRGAAIIKIERLLTRDPIGRLRCAAVNPAAP